MSARDASVEAYREYAVSETGQLQQFDRWFKHNGPATRAMAGDALGFPANVYSARVNRLIKDGRLVETSRKDKCEVTGFTASWVVHIDRLMPADLGVGIDCPRCQANSGIYEQTKECCAARFILNSHGDPELGITTAVRRHGFDEPRFRLIIQATRNWLRARALQRGITGTAANEGTI